MSTDLSTTHWSDVTKLMFGTTKGRNLRNLITHMSFCPIRRQNLYCNASNVHMLNILSNCLSDVISWLNKLFLTTHKTEKLFMVRVLLNVISLGTTKQLTQSLYVL